MKHPYADILIAISDGKEIQWYGHTGEQATWVDQSASTVLADITGKDYSPERYRVKPTTITINGVECEKNVKGLEAHYSVVVCAYGSAENQVENVWFATKEARDAAYAALIKPFGEKA